MSLIEAVFALTAAMPASRSSLKSQMERAAISVAANIAEGYGRGGRKEYLQFLSISAGSLQELETFLLIVKRTCSVPQEKLGVALELADECGRVLTGLRKSLRV